MSRHDSLIIKDTHRGLLYEDGLFREILPAGRFQIPRVPSRIARFFGVKAPKVEVVLVDVRGRDRTVVVQDLLTADGVTISASFVVQFRVEDPVAATHEVKSFEERLYGEAQTAARRILRGMSLEEVLITRDEIGEELLRQVCESASTYGVEVSGIDFKDLIVPENLKQIMNQAVLARRLRLVKAVEAGAEEDDFETTGDDGSDSELVIANARFDRAHNEEADHDQNREPRPEKLPIRPTRSRLGLRESTPITSTSRSVAASLEVLNGSRSRSSGRPAISWSGPAAGPVEVLTIPLPDLRLTRGNQGGPGDQ